MGPDTEKTTIRETTEIDESIKLLKQAGVDASVTDALEKIKNLISAETVNAEITKILKGIKGAVISCLVSNSVSKKTVLDCDKIIDDAENDQDISNISYEEAFKNKVKNVLEKVLENLKKYLNIKGIGIVYNDPLTKKPQEITTAGITEGRVSQITTDYDPKDNFHPYGSEFHHIQEMKFGTRPVGNIDFIFSDTRNEQLIMEVTEAVKSVIDTFLDNQLKKFLQHEIEMRKREIIEKNYSKTGFKWRDIIIELFKILKEMGMDGMLICKRFDAQKPAITRIDGKGNITETCESEDFALQDMVKRYGFDFNGMQDITYPNLQKFLGSFLFKYDNTTDKEMLIFIAECLSDVLRQREDIRYELVKSVGLRYANAIIDNNVEMQGKHEIVTLIGDINGYSSFTREISECVKQGVYKQDPLPDIMDRFSEQISAEIDRDDELKGVLDKIVGDEVIIHFRLPFDKEGKDIEGKTEGEHDISLYVQRALKMCSKVQQIFDKVLHEVENEFKINLPRYPKFSFGIKSYEDVVGIYGNLKNPESRIQITVFGPGINETARIQTGAKEGAILIEEKTWEKYLEGNGTEFSQTGLPIIILGKNIKDPINAVNGLTSLEIDEMEARQEQFFKEQEPLRQAYYKKNPRAKTPYYYCTEETMHLLPEGDYTVAMSDEEPDGPVILEVARESHRFKIKLPRDKVINLQYPIGQQALNKLIEERKEFDCSQRKTFRVRNNKFYLIKYVDIEEIVREQIEVIKAKNKESQQDHFTLEQLPAGKYEIIKKEDEKDGDTILTLSRSGTSLKLLIQENQKKSIIGKITDRGYVEHREGCLYF
ncbi:hypothetical protein JW911_01900 [Candidatus Peregrinibacteria bacterium]|nr:hypothetical protein [Candidatus Peregrinibacteria bacterium]